MPSKNAEKYEAEFWERLKKLPETVQRAGTEVIAGFSEAFHEQDGCSMHFRSGARRSQGGVYYAKGKNNFAVIDRDTRLGAIRIGIHANRDELKACAENLYVEDSEHDSRLDKGPRVQSILLKDSKDVPKVIECAKAARERWGRGLREV